MRLTRRRAVIAAIAAIAASTVTAVWFAWWYQALTRPPVTRGGPDIAARLVAPPAGSQVMLVFQNQRTSDRRRAGIIRFVSEAVPLDRWPIVVTDSDKTFLALADDYYDLFHSGASSSPLSTDAIVEALRRGNPGVREPMSTGTRVRLPPLPARARDEPQRDGPGEAFRVFSPRLASYTVTRNAAALRLPVRAQAMRLAAQLSVERNTDATGIVLDATPALMEAMARAQELPALIVNATPARQRAGGVDTDAAIELLNQPPPGSSCGDPLAPLKASPFYASTRAMMKALSPQRRSAMVALAIRKQLVILDTQVSLPRGHGRKVLDVATTVLKALGADDDLVRTVRTFDLLPTTPESGAQLAETLRDYFRILPPVPDAEKKRAEEWIKNTSTSAGGNSWPETFEMPEALIQAVLWKHFVVGADDRGAPAQRKAAWLNMSFRVKSTALAVVIGKFRKGEALSFVAAGREQGRGVPAGYVPQDGAMSSNHFILVTHGTPERIDGPTSDDTVTGPPVSLVAPGCGYGGGADSGSSFAAPYVAAAAWLRYLHDASEGDLPATATLVRDLMVASRPTPAFSKVRSGGFFDAAQFLANPSGSHLVLRSGFESLRSFSLTPTCESAAPFTYQSAPPPHGKAISSFFVAGATSKRQLWHRRVNEAGTSEVGLICTLKDLSLTATPQSGPSWTHTLSAFGSDILSLTGPTP